MKYERINKKYTKIIVISLAVIIIIGSVLVLNITKAKYKTTISVPIVSGTIKYTGGNADLNVMAVYQQKVTEENKPIKCINGDDCYDSKEEIPQSGYALNKDKSYCTLTTKENKLENTSIEYKYGKVYIEI